MYYVLFTIFVSICIAAGKSADTASNECLEAIENQPSMRPLFELDEPLALQEGEVDALVTLKGQLIRRDYFEESEEAKHYWVLKLNPESFKLAIQTPVLMAFQTPKGIMEWPNHDEIQLGGACDQGDWLHDHLNKRVSLQGVLFHAHTGHHHTPIQMDVLKICN